MDKVKQILNTISQSLYDKKGANILALDVREFSDLTDYLVIAEGNVERHLKALALEVIEELKKIDVTLLEKEGMDGGGWIVLDYGEIVVHLMLEEIRERYQLEALFRKAALVDLTINVSSGVANDHE